MGRSIWYAEPVRRTAPTRERLMDSAALLFYEHGFHAIGLDRILAEVGVTKTTFYNHFESKDELIVAVLEHRDERDMDLLRVELARRGGGPRAGMVAVFDILDDWFRDDTFRGCLFINAAAQFPNPHDPVHVAATRHGMNLHRVFANMGRAAGAGDPELLARQLGMLAAAAVTARHVGGDPEAARTARQMAQALLDGALAPAPAPRR
ncbi:MAG TPA: TetR/AcrR family transcriptional regulator [Planctomycetota bacterium]|nr:TetR/AcrR family transcriptional regulator [Planctomycetota bacterium]